MTQTQERPPSRRRAGASASEKTLLVLEAALTHSRFTDVVAAPGWRRPRRTASSRPSSSAASSPSASDGGYLPGPKILSLGRAGALAAHRHLGDRPAVRRRPRRPASRCTVHVGAANGDEIVYLIRSRLRQAVPDAVASRPRDPDALLGDRQGRARPTAPTTIGAVRRPRRTAARGPSTRSRTLSDLRAEIAHVRRVGLRPRPRGERARCRLRRRPGARPHGHRRLRREHLHAGRRALPRADRGHGAEASPPQPQPCPPHSGHHA